MVTAKLKSYDQTIKDFGKNLDFPVSISIIKDYNIHNSYYFNCDVHKKFQAASISKVLASIIVLKLIEENKLDIDRNINDYLSKYKISDKKGNNIKVTLKQLLSHTAGINVRGFPGYSINDKIPTLDQILKGIKPCNTEKIVVNDAPGKKYSYSGGGFMIIQKVIEDVSGMKYEKLANLIVLKPLKMHDSDFKIRKNPYFNKHPENTAAGLWSTSNDLGKLLGELLLSYHGKSNIILSKNSIRKMFKPISNADEDQVGLGIFITKNNKNIFHDGWNYNFRCMMMGSVHTGKGIIFMENSDKDYKIVDKIYDLI